MEISAKLENFRGIGISGQSSPEPAGQGHGFLRALRNNLGEFLVQAFARAAAVFDRVRLHSAPKRRMRVLETLALGGRRQLVLVMCDEQEYLVGTGAEGVETIVARQPTATAPAVAAPASSTVAGATKNRVGTMLRTATIPGPWLVTSCGKGAGENRTREPQGGVRTGLQSEVQSGIRNGIGQELWQ